MAARASKPSTHAQQRAALRKGRARVWQSGSWDKDPPVGGPGGGTATRHPVQPVVGFLQKLGAQRVSLRPD